MIIILKKGCFFFNSATLQVVTGLNEMKPQHWQCSCKRASGAYYSPVMDVTDGLSGFYVLLRHVRDIDGHLSVCSTLFTVTFFSWDNVNKTWPDLTWTTSKLLKVYFKLKRSPCATHTAHTQQCKMSLLHIIICWIMVLICSHLTFSAYLLLETFISHQDVLYMNWRKMNVF